MRRTESGQKNEVTSPTKRIPPPPLPVYESESEEEEESGHSEGSIVEQGVHKTQPSTPILTIRPQRSSSLANSTPTTPVSPTLQRTESPTNYSDESYEEEDDSGEGEEESEEEDEYAPRQIIGDSRKPRSRAATLVIESMASPSNARYLKFLIYFDS